jgi:hypothetical protein
MAETLMAIFVLTILLGPMVLMLIRQMIMLKIVVDGAARLANKTTLFKDEPKEKAPEYKKGGFKYQFKEWCEDKD